MNAAASSSFQRQPGGLLELLGQLPSLEFPAYSPALLVVDDNRSFLAMLGEGLRPFGLQVWLAGGAQEALRIYRQNRGHIGVVLLDVSMPDLDGPETLGLLRKVDPTLVCCFMMYRVLPLLAVLALVCLVGAPALAADETVAEGTVVKAGDGKLTIADKDKKEHSCTVGKDAKITCDGKACKLDDLKKGVKVKVTLEGKGDKAMATKIDASTK